MEKYFIHQEALKGLFDTLDNDTLLLTSNNRLTAKISSYYQHYQTKQNHPSWQSLNILPFNTWLIQLFEHLAAQGIGKPLTLLSHYQEQTLWESIIQQSSETTPLLQINATAKTAQQAWQLLQHWQIDLNDTQLTKTEDCAQFIYWAEQFDRTKVFGQYLDQASLINHLRSIINKEKISLPSKIILIGFWEFPPVYKKFLETLEKRQVKLQHFQLICQNKSIARATCSDTMDEIFEMAYWANHLVTEKKGITVACIVPNLNEHRNQIARIFKQVFKDDHADELPFDVSLGEPLIEIPIIHAALNILRLALFETSMDDISILLRSPFFSFYEAEKHERALLDIELRNIGNATYNLSSLIKTLSNIHIIETEHLLSHLHAMNSIAPINKKSINEWIEVFTQLLETANWPGDVTLSSEEYQAAERFQQLFYELSSLSSVLPKKISAANALKHLQRLATQTIFQSQSPEKPIQILGMLEAAGSIFDYVWVMGLDHLHWPLPAKQNALLPSFLQRNCKMPHASNEHELQFSKHMMENFISGSQYLTLSYPSKQDDVVLNPSVLIQNFETINETFLPLREPVKTATLETIQDDYGPALTDQETIHGGTAIFKSQSRCPFQAFAKYRLNAITFDNIELGLTALERGLILHQTMEMVWKQIKTKTALCQLIPEELQSIIEIAIKETIQIVFKNRLVGKTLIQLEQKRLQQLITDWLALEKQREPFTIVEQEKLHTITIATLKINVRIDRIDQLHNNKYALLDYKTGLTNINGWFGERLEEPQLPLYAVFTDLPIESIAFAQVRTDNMCFRSISAISGLMPDDKTLDKIKTTDAENNWAQQFNTWKQNLTQLANAFCDGHAQADPKNNWQTCQYCDLQPLCRTYERKTS